MVIRFLKHNNLNNFVWAKSYLGVPVAVLGSDTSVAAAAFCAPETAAVAFAPADA